jgi:hypothetical protein
MKGWPGTTAAELYAPYARHASATGGGRTTSFASLRRFCAIAASVNSNWAPHGPRNENGQLSAAVAAIKEKGVLRGQRIERREVGRPGEFVAFERCSH